MSGFTINHARLCCDAPSCAATFDAPGTITMVRRVSINDGWRHAIRRRLDSGPAPTFDFCPAHHDEIARVGAVEVRP